MLKFKLSFIIKLYSFEGNSVIGIGLRFFIVFCLTYNNSDIYAILHIIYGDLYSFSFHKKRTFQITYPDIDTNREKT